MPPIGYFDVLRMKITSAICLLFFAAPFCGNSQDFHVKVIDFDGASGYSEAFEIKREGDAHGIRASITGKGGSWEIVFEGKVEETQLDDFFQYLVALDHPRIKESLFIPQIFDGHQVFYTIQIEGKSVVEHTVSNIYHEPLIDFCRRMNKMFPETHRIRIPKKEWFEHVVEFEPKSEQVSSLNSEKPGASLH